MEVLTTDLEGFSLTAPPPNTPAPERPSPTVWWGDWTDTPDNSPMVLCVRPASVQGYGGGLPLTGNFASDSQSQSRAFEEATGDFRDWWTEHGLSHVDSSLTDEEASRVINSLWLQMVERSGEACIHYDSVLVVRPRVGWSADHHVTDVSACSMLLGVTITPMSEYVPGSHTSPWKFTTMVSIPLIWVEGVNDSQNPSLTPESTYQRDLTREIKVFDDRLSDI